MVGPVTFGPVEEKRLASSRLLQEHAPKILKFPLSPQRSFSSLFNGAKLKNQPAAREHWEMFRIKVIGLRVCRTNCR